MKCVSVVCGTTSPKSPRLSSAVEGTRHTEKTLQHSWQYIICCHMDYLMRHLILNDKPCSGKVNYILNYEYN